MLYVFFLCTFSMVIKEHVAAWTLSIFSCSVYGIFWWLVVKTYVKPININPLTWWFEQLSSSHILWLIFWFCYLQWLGMKFLTRGNGRLRMNKETRAKLVKCSESLWKLTYYGAAEAFILYTIYDEPWFRDTRLFFKGWPNQELK